VLYYGYKSKGDIIMSDTQRWAEATDKELYPIAEKWAKQYNMKTLRAFQERYSNLQGQTKDTTELRCYQNMWQCLTFAIDIKAFGKGKK
jgi:hypothetical protein